MQVKGGETKIVTLVPADFRAGESGDYRWSSGVLNQERRISTSLTFEEGVQEIGIGAMEAGLVLERVILYKKGTEKKEAYLGPVESYCV